METATLEAPAAAAPSDAPGAAEQAPAPPKPGVHPDALMFQGFGWDSWKHEGGWWKHVAALVPELKAAGCTHLWLPPPSQSVAPQGYLPGQLYNLSASKYGSEQDLKALVAALKEAGIVAIADVVINHRCADEQVDGVWNKYRDDADHRGMKIDWGRWAITGTDPVFRGEGAADSGADFEAAPDIDHTSPELRAALVDWLSWLRDDVGFGGWRFDYVKGYGAEWVAEYVSKTLGADALSVGELWTDMAWEGSSLAASQDRARQQLCDWVSGAKETAFAFDFPTKGVLQEALSKAQLWRMKDSAGKPPGLIGWWPSRAVTFIENHDTGSSQGHWPFPSGRVPAGYAYTLTHPGVPCVFWEHYFGWGREMREAIDGLLQVRRRNRIASDSKLKIRIAEGDLYVAVVDDRVAVKLGPRMDLGVAAPRPEEGWAVAVSGRDFCVWDKTGDDRRRR